jgi:hypothetical protein
LCASGSATGSALGADLDQRRDERGDLLGDQIQELLGHGGVGQRLAAAVARRDHEAVVVDEAVLRPVDGGHLDEVHPEARRLRGAEAALGVDGHRPSAHLEGERPAQRIGHRAAHLDGGAVGGGDERAGRRRADGERRPLVGDAHAHLRHCLAALLRRDVVEAGAAESRWCSGCRWRRR